MTALKTASNIEQLAVNTIRFLSVDGVEKAQSGHPGTPMEAAPLAYVLWTEFLRHNPKDPRWPNRDRFVLSCGHASMLLYSLLHLSGYDLSLDDLKNFRQWNSRTPGHPEHGLTPGVETTTGPLGQGFANGVGMAVAQAALAARFNRPGFAIVDHFVDVFASDGDIMEGVASEAASLAGHLKLGRLKCVYLDNHITIEGKTDLALSEDVQKRFEAYGWDVLRVADANNLDEIRKAFRASRAQAERPTLLIARTHIGFGSPNKQDTAKAHGEPLGAEEVLLTKKNLGWPAEPLFFVPDDVRAHMASAAAKGAEAQSAWRELFDRYKAAHPDLAAEWERPPLPASGWKDKLPAYKAGQSLATRQASGETINALAPVLPALIGGSADLAPSNNTNIKGGGDFSAAVPAGRNLHFGVREHAMGAVLNGLAVSGRLIPYGASFLTFTDYMKPAIRLACLMELGVVYIMTHDSVGLGEDGPTHQPIDHLAMLRAIPGLCVIRPADAAETAQAWRVALERRHGPTLLALTRQKLPVLDRPPEVSAENLDKGAYVLNPAEKNPAVLLIATGSEVHLAAAAAAKLGAENVRARVVSMPSWDLFEKQPAAYRDAVLPPAVRARVSIEAAASLGWHRYAGDKGVVLGLDRFGASAPGDTVLEKLGFTAENIMRAARKSVALAAS